MPPSTGNTILPPPLSNTAIESAYMPPSTGNTILPPPNTEIESAYMPPSDETSSVSPPPPPSNKGKSTLKHNKPTLGCDCG
eukprot:CAMPEP_0203689996 /NCGR_PEP_ID=MMETSP0091-20130426/2387_1 /ASSEMBLY_ACC=CAM_ASM_001089 /TAXON_ID=426623 /ORGANISM="Chaetoceros affinis, Strain CCMP159" /LENGTH=80 /DNA_ID=CAMNT_0050559923 /DNA_START=12 /DNA_END=250 /DNA_ORIENTATION=+